MMAIIRKYPAYRKLLLSSVTAKFGNSITVVVLMYAIATSTNKPIYISLVLLAEMVPMILFGLFAGALADKYPRYKVMIASEWIQTITVVGMIFSLHNPLLLLVLIFLQNVAAAFFLPARSAFISELVPREALTEAIGLSQSVYQAISIIGPALAGVMLLIFEPSLILIINVATFIISTLFIYLASKHAASFEPPKKALQPESLLQSIRIGVKSTLQVPALRYLIVLLSLVMFAAGIFNANAEVIELQLFKVSEFHYGLLGAMSGVGGIIGSLLGPVLIKKMAPNKFFIAAAVLLGGWMIVIVPSYLFGGSLQLLLLYIWVIAIGVLNAFLNIPISSIFLAITPNEIKGRAVSIMQMTVNLAIVVGILTGGILASLISILTATALAGAATIVAAIVSMNMKGFGSLNTAAKQNSASRHSA